MAAPVVPIHEARTVPIPRMTAFTHGVPRSVPRTTYCEPLNVKSAEPLLPPSVVPELHMFATYEFGALFASQVVRACTVPCDTFLRSPCG